MGLDPVAMAVAAVTGMVPGLLQASESSWRRRFKGLFTMDLGLITQAFPLTAIVCLVYCATRFELPEKIVRSALVMFGKTILFLGVAWLLLLWVSG
jgi:hypothetical protein